VTSRFGQLRRTVASWALTALLCALALPLQTLQTDNGLLLTLGALAATFAAIGLCAVLVCGRTFVPRVAPTGLDVHGALQRCPARQHDPDAAGRVRPRAPGRVRRHD